MISLEKKRQKHALEQEAQELNAASSQRVKPTHNVSAANATPPKRKVIAVAVVAILVVIVVVVYVIY